MKTYVLTVETSYNGVYQESKTAWVDRSKLCLYVGRLVEVYPRFKVEVEIFNTNETDPLPQTQHLVEFMKD